MTAFVKALFVLSFLLAPFTKAIAQNTAYQKEVNKAKAWNTEQFNVIKVKFGLISNCYMDKVKLTVLKTQFDINGEAKYGPKAYSEGQKAHDKIVARRVEAKGCDKTAIFIYPSDGNWLIESKSWK